MQPLYVEISDEITTVIGRMKEAEENSVALVVPKGAILLQSVVNLKLAKRAAKEAGKELTVITTDKIGRNLCKQVGIAIFSRLNDKNIPESDEDEAADDDTHVINGVKVHRYYDEGEEPAAEEEVSAKGKGKQNDEPPIVVPKEVLKEAPQPEVPEAETPITVRSVAVAATAAATSTESATAADIPNLPDATITVPEDKEVKPPLHGPDDTAKVVVPADPAIKVSAHKPVNPKNGKRKRHPVVFVAYIIIVLLLAGGASGAYFLPRTVVTISIKPTAWTQQATITAKAGTSVPAQTLTGTATDTLTFKASGTRDIGNKATGTAQLANARGEQVSLPAGTIITYQNQTFTLDSATTIPAGTPQLTSQGYPTGNVTPSTVNANITATAAGSANNLSQVTATVYVQPYGNISTTIVSTAGGTSQTVNIITAADITTAQTNLATQLKTDATAKLTTQTQADTLYDSSQDTFAVSNFASSVAAGTQADTATATATGTITRLATSKSAVIGAAQSQAKSAERAANTTELITGTTITGTVYDASAGTVTVATTTKGSSSPTIDVTGLQTSLSGKKLADGITQVKAASKGGTYVIVQTPAWWPLHNFPLSSHFLTVTVQYD